MRHLLILVLLASTGCTALNISRDPLASDRHTTEIYPDAGDAIFHLEPLHFPPEKAEAVEDEYTGSWAGLRWFLDFQWLK